MYITMSICSQISGDHILPLAASLGKLMALDKDTDAEAIAMNKALVVQKALDAQEMINKAIDEHKRDTEARMKSKVAGIEELFQRNMTIVLEAEEQLL